MAEQPLSLWGGDAVHCGTSSFCRALARLALAEAGGVGFRSSSSLLLGSSCRQQHWAVAGYRANVVCECDGGWVGGWTGSLNLRPSPHAQQGISLPLQQQQLRFFGLECCGLAPRRPSMQSLLRQGLSCSTRFCTQLLWRTGRAGGSLQARRQASPNMAADLSIAVSPRALK